MATQALNAQQMIAQLRLIDPSISAAIGTPERKIIDTLAQAISDNQIDLDALSAGLDLDSKFGDQLDRFLAIFGFSRQRALFATGFVTFTRATAATTDIRIPANSLVQAPADTSGADGNPLAIQFQTTYDVILATGSTSIVAPIRAVIAGEQGNVAAERITEMIGPNTIYGVTSVVNEFPTQNGADAESDEEYKIRFKNTVFRNLAGTPDQFMALAIATAFTTKANVVGPQSHYREYIQLPPVDDDSAYDVNLNTGGSISESGDGNSGEYTSALSTVPFAKYIYATEFPAFVSNGEQDLLSYFYRQDVDYTFNSPPINKGDTARFATIGLDVTASLAPLRPNVTFANVYTGTDDTVQAIRPNDLVLLEFNYLSSASRNDPGRHIMNAVDVYIDGGNEAFATTILSRPKTNSLVIDDPTSKWHHENYRRIGDASKRPMTGNIIVPLMWQPILSLPDQIVVGTDTYFNGINYWAVEDVSPLGGTVRGRSGIEFSLDQKGKAQSDTSTDPATWTGKIITDNSGDPPGGRTMAVTNYTYDKNVIDLQAALDGAKQVTTDVLAHRARTRYLKLDITVMYTEGYTAPNVNTQIHDAVDSYLRSRFFGTAVQLSDLLQTIHNVPGVDNVRWTGDTPAASSALTPRIYKVSRDGVPLLNVTTERVRRGAASIIEIQQLFLTGEPTGGSFKLTWNGNVTSSLLWNATATQIQTALNALPGNSVTVVEDSRSTTNVRNPIRSFRVGWLTTNAKPLITLAPGTSTLVGGYNEITTDFFLPDDEQVRLAENAYSPSVGVVDTVPGLIIRPRAQNTWTRAQ